MSYERMEKRAAELDAEVERWLSAAADADAAEDRAFGANKSGDELPKWVADKKKRAEKIKAAKAELEAEAKAAAAARSIAALRDRLRAKTKRTRGDALETIVVDLNPTLRGWFNYYQHAWPRMLTHVDGFVRHRLRAILRKQEQRPGQGRCLADPLRWPNAFFGDQGRRKPSLPLSEFRTDSVFCQFPRLTDTGRPRARA